MREPWRAQLERLPIQGIGLLLLALVAAFGANQLASSARKLAWSGRPLASHPMPPWIPQVPSPTVKPRPTLAAPLPPLAPAPQPKPRRDAEPEPQPIQDISTAQAWEAFQRKHPFLDARRSTAFEEGHILGAWSASPWESDLDNRITAFEASTRISHRDPLVIYCSGQDCQDSHQLAFKLALRGYRDLRIYRGGFPEWQSMGRPVETGARP